ncbi:MAG: sialate O-acetylesterase [Armatimonadota bacterium]
MARFLLVLLLCGCGLGLRAEVTLPALFSDNMVLQRGIAAPVWGKAAPGEQITISIAGQQVTAAAGADGRWQARLAPLQAGGPFQMTVAGKNTITLRNVLVGEVWVCSGQSNMQFMLVKARDGVREADAANHPQIRLFTVPNATAAAPLADCAATWAVCSKDTVRTFSAVAYFFARDLQQALGVPIGLIHSSWGGTPAEAWTDRETLLADPALKGLTAPLDAKLSDHARKIYEQYGDVLRAWLQEADRAKAEGKPLPPMPADLSAAMYVPPLPPNTPTSLFNGKIAPLVPFGIAGVIWYQGEANAGRATQYRTLFPAMIRGWRRQWGQGDFPFLFVQLANYMAAKPEPGPSRWAELREAQAMTLALPKTGMAVAIDVGEATDIHPTNKQDVGKRLALAAQAVAYGKPLEYSGPLYDRMDVQGSTVRLRFIHAAGLRAGPAPGAELTGFAVAGEDKQFVWAKAVIDGDTVVVSSDQVPAPVAVRYGWADNPACNLYNGAGLPASPFRTDDWQE